MRKVHLAVGMMVLALCLMSANGGDGDCHETASILRALEYHSARHPYSHYRDIYKSFMQDRFGPGHILLDTAKSAAYLRRELSETGTFGGPLYEPTGAEGNFYRVNISLIKDGIVPFDTFFNAFVKSAQTVSAPSGEEWMKEWVAVDSLMDAEGFRFKGQEQEREELRIQFEQGDYVVHHSKEFNDSSLFHYRIISRSLFGERIKPLV